MLTPMDRKNLEKAVKEAEAFAYNARLCLSQTTNMGYLLMTENFMRRRTKDLKTALTVLTAKPKA